MIYLRLSNVFDKVDKKLVVERLGHLKQDHYEHSLDLCVSLWVWERVIHYCLFWSLTVDENQIIQLRKSPSGGFFNPKFGNLDDCKYFVKRFWIR